MKKTRRIAAFAAAMAMAATMAMPMAMNASAAATENTISFTGATGTHTYKAYRIFNGAATANGMNTSEGAVLANAEWAGTASKLADFISALQADSTIGADFTSVTDVAGIINVISGYDANSTKAKAFAKVAVANAEACGLPATAAGATISAATDGYYVIEETSAGGTVKTSYLLGVYDASAGAEIAVKSAAPTVDKQVSDEVGDKDKTTDPAAEIDSTDSTVSWGETADHQINEKFQFKLKATIPADADLADYNTYRLVFTDELNAGVTFEDIESVKVNGADVTEYDATTAKSGYLFAPVDTGAAETTIDDTDYVGGGKFALTIGDIKKYIPTGKSLGVDEITVEVIYNAHLNENAAVVDADAAGVATTYANVNNVMLSYSSNPNVTGSGNSADIPSTGTPDKPGTPGTTENPTTPGNEEELGDTPKDYVWVFTYTANGTKVDGATKQPDGTYTTKLGGAEFELYSDSACTNKINLAQDANNKYYPSSTGTAVITSSSVTATLGEFEIKGLDAGTYYLKETKAPDGGYNLLANPITVTIGADHLEATALTANVDLTSEATHLNLNIENNMGSTLPSTGGMGTRLFVLGGGCMAGLAGLYLVSKKRSKDAE